MREKVIKKLKDGHTQVIYYYHPRSFWDVILGKGRIEEIHTFDKDGKSDGEDIYYTEKGAISSKQKFQKDEWVYTEHYKHGKLDMKDYPRADGRVLREWYAANGKDITEKSVINFVGPSGIEFDGPFVRYDEGKVVDKGVSVPVGYVSKHIRDRKTLTEFLDGSSSKWRKEKVVRQYREVFPKTEQEKAERKAERMARQKKIKESRAQGK